MKPRPLKTLTTLLLASFCLSAAALAQEAGNNHVLDPEEWPRIYEVNGAEVAIYMPQILEWDDFLRLKATSAIGVKMPGAKTAAFGAVAIKANTVADPAQGTVQIGTREFSGFRFPELNATDAAKAEQMVKSVLTPEAPLELPMATVTAALQRDDASLRETAVSFEPPPIFYSSTPAVLVTFIGPPSFEAAGDEDPSVLFATNTNWDVLYDGKQYFLLAENQWQTTQDVIKGPWTPAKTLPASFSKLPDNTNWSDVKASLEQPASTEAQPRVFTSDRPAEIIVTKGKPQLVPVSGTGLMYVANTESDLFLHPATKTYYFLTAGRWFSATSLEGPWISAMETLPEDFGRIPESHPKAHVLASVQGSPQADEAVILASIPQTATVDRSTTVQVAYEGEPQFKPVTGTQEVQYAVNTSNDVFLVNGSYYCCHQGVWFQSPKATGAWAVCAQVPPAIYTIPAASPKHHVTYVHIYDSTPTTVNVGVTSGYSGCYIARGLVVFGLGMWLGHELANDHWHHHYYPNPSWYGYGCGAVYYHGQGFYSQGARHYGPYGGAGYGAVYHPSTGGYTRASYAYGPRGAVAGRSAYNPWTNTAAGRVTAKTPYGSWGHSAVVRDDEWVRAAHRSNFNGTVAGAQTSRGGAVVGVNRRYGSDAFVGKTAGGDVYVGRDGNIYKRDAEDGWQKRQQGGWVNEPSVPNQPGRPTYPNRGRPTTLPATTSVRPGQPSGTPTTRPIAPAVPTTRPAVPTTRPSVPTDRPNIPTTRPATPATPSTPTTRPAVPTNKPNLPTTRPTAPVAPTTPTTRPAVPTDRPNIPTTRPAAPVAPSTPTTRPTAPTTRPTAPATRPTAPATRPASSMPARTGYNSTQSTAAQLNRDSYSRAQSTRSAPARTSGGKRGGR